MEKRNDCFEEPFKKRARVILRPNGDVHIAFATSTSIQATARAVLELLQDPMGFIDEGCTKYTVTTNEICRRGQKIIPLEDIIGLDLAFITAERRVVCDFTEIFGKLFSSFGGSNMDLPLNMWDVVNDVSQNSMLDEKAFLLRYYLEVSKFLAEKDMPPIERHIKLRDEVQLAIIKIALNSLKYPKQKSTQRPTDVSELLSVSPVPDIEPEAALDEDIDPDLIGTKECAHILGITMQQVRNKIRSGEIRAIQADNGYFFISKQDLPTPKKRRNKQQKHVRLSGSWEEVQEIIRENNYFTEAVAPYITNATEMNYFAQSHREIIIDGRPALIIDIHPDFITPDGRTNRQLIMDEKSPICPDSPDGTPYHLHHMAKRADAPLAIISTKDHRSYNKYLHQAPNDPKMDRAKFDMQRISFWRSYLELYDAYGFNGIPYLNTPIDTKPK